jgi:hypothetical protein
MCRKAGGDDGACVALLAAGGAADCLSSIFRDTLWNSTIPDRLRGRVAGIEVVSYALGAPMAGVILGTLSRFTGVRAALASSAGTAIVLIALTAIRTPSLRRVSVRAQDDLPRAMV